MRFSKHSQSTHSVQLAGSSLADSESSLSEMYQPQDEVGVCKTLLPFVYSEAETQCIT